MGRTIRMDVCAALILLASAVSVHAQPAFPPRPIRWVVDFPAGGASDTMARIVGQKLGEAWNTQVTVENLPGANGIIAAEQLARARPDGYTIGLISTSFALNPSLYKNLSYNTRRDFTPIALMAMAPNVLVVNPDLPVKSVQDLVDLAKQKPNTLNYASVGNGSSPHLSAEMLKRASGITAIHIPYLASGPALEDLIAGRADFMFVNLSAALPSLRAGKINVLAVGGDRRSTLLAGTPTMVEAGLPDFISVRWYGVAGPAGLPPELARRYNAAINLILAQPDVRERIELLGADTRTMSPAQFVDFINKDAQRWSRAVKNSGTRMGN
jgi:tripartite-type tricarboxylate transporter receptor subunit TctC